jgi:hypothetical protein
MMEMLQFPRVLLPLSSVVYASSLGTTVIALLKHFESRP